PVVREPAAAVTCPPEEQVQDLAERDRLHALPAPCRQSRLGVGGDGRESPPYLDRLAGAEFEVDPLLPGRHPHPAVENRYAPARPPARGLAVDPAPAPLLVAHRFLLTGCRRPLG